MLGIILELIIKYNGNYFHYYFIIPILKVLYICKLIKLIKNKMILHEKLNKEYNFLCTTNLETLYCYIIVIQEKLTAYLEDSALS